MTLQMTDKIMSQFKRTDIDWEGKTAMRNSLGYIVSHNLKIALRTNGIYYGIYFSDNKYDTFFPDTGRITLYCEDAGTRITAIAWFEKDNRKYSLEKGFDMLKTELPQAFEWCLWNLL